MLKIKVYRDKDEIVGGAEVEGTAEELCAELCGAFETGLECILEPLKKDGTPEKVIRKLELATTGTIIASFIANRAGMSDDEKFINGMLDTAVQFLQGNILMNSQEGREKIFELLEELVADDEQEQPDGDSDGEE